MIKALLLNHDGPNKGTAHKVAHNITTIANIPLALWFIYAVYTLKDADYTMLQEFIAAPVNLVAAVLFVLVTLKHFVLEIEVVLEDYISNLGARHFAIIALKIFAFVLCITTTISILKIGL